MRFLKNRDQRGQAIIIVIIFLGMAMASAIYLNSLVSSGQQAVRHTNDALVALNAAEAGVQKALACLNGTDDARCGGNAGGDYPGEVNVTVGNGKFTSTVTVSVNKRVITSTGTGPDGTRRSIRATASAVQTPSSISFAFATQIDVGGMVMEQNSQIIGAGTPPTAGNIYANGPVSGENGATITGDVTVATTTQSLDGVIVYGNARAPKITDSKICGNAYYSTIDSSSRSFLNSPKNPPCPTPLTPGVGSASSTPASANLPISDELIADWKNAAAAGGAITGDCGDSGVPECVINDDDTVSLGPKKVIGDLILTKKQTLIISGALHFTGNVDINSSNGATIKCAAAYGGASCFIIVDGWIHVQNNAVFQGSETAGSYLLILTTLNNCNGGTQAPSCTHHNAAIDLHNNATGAIFYSGQSMIFLHNGVHLTEVVANKLHLDNNAVITYEQGLLNSQFTSGPTGNWLIDKGTWQEIKL